MISKLDKRRNEILSILSEVPISSTQQLAERTNVSSETIRKDLDALADKGMIIKVHGGVALASGNPNEIPFDLRASRNSDKKRAIAQKAFSLIRPNDTILLESCTTNLELARELIGSPELLETLIIVTNSFSIASILDGGKKCKRMFFLGGWVNPSQYSALGHKTALMLQDFYVSKAFLSGAALSSEFMLTAYYQDDVDFQKNALSAAEKVILMIDSSKFGQTAVFSVCDLIPFDYLITDRQFSREELSRLKAANTKYIRAEI